MYVQAEVRQYSSALIDKSAIIVGNKVDLLASGSSNVLNELRTVTGMPVHFVSARHGHGIDSLRKALSMLLSQDGMTSTG